MKLCIFLFAVGTIIVAEARGRVKERQGREGKVLRMSGQECFKVRRDNEVSGVAKGVGVRTPKGRMLSACRQTVAVETVGSVRPIGGRNEGVAQLKTNLQRSALYTKRG